MIWAGLGNTPTLTKVTLLGTVGTVGTGLYYSAKYITEKASLILEWIVSLMT